ncbi:mitogen-activated protein kinase kinase kinase 1 isoform X3 [Eucalyptus grandis]|uniref:mitogen-activated protein kinase kinase kinase 1 isoform X3 n=1 Tax=Eucalyptus grandis TaxID=71139 RepID=UPI00192EC5F6|nr:mitogen-activated protein kinase kinase kinase 1 isoform X3 [Eucalyptus grandis]
MEIAGGGIGGGRPTVLSPPSVKLRPVVVDKVSSTSDLLKSFGPQEGPGGDEDSPVRPLNQEGPGGDEDSPVRPLNQEGPGGDEDSPVRPLNKEDWSDGDDEKVSERSTSQGMDDWHSCLSTSLRDEECDDKDDVGNTLPASGSKDDAGNTLSASRSFIQRITSWDKGLFLGSGSFGSVYEAISDEGFFFAVKEVSLLDQGSQGKQSLLQLELEISLLSQFKHENIVRYLGTDKDDKKLYIFLELMTKGSLASLYQVYHLKDSQVSSYTRQILNGLKYLHDRHVLHRDIKCANILVDASGSLKLADFGLAKAIKMNDAKSLKGSAFWMAPEVVNLKYTSYGLAADIWSLGCTVLEMLTGQPPYSPLEAVCY